MFNLRLFFPFENGLNTYGTVHMRRLNTYIYKRSEGYVEKNCDFNGGKYE